jgi:hypothetical protein
MIPPEASVRLPLGELREASDGSIRVALRVPPGERARVGAFFERVASFAGRHGAAAALLAPASMEPTEAGLELAYACAGTEGFDGAAWRADAATRLPALLALARAVSGALTALVRAGWGTLPLSPRQVRVGEGGTLRLIALPPLAASLAEYAAADREAWVWAPPEALRGETETGATYAAGALLHAGIAGDPLPSHLPRAEQLARLLRGRSGTHAALAVALEAALPRALAEDGEALARAVTQLLDPDRAQRAGEEELEAVCAALPALRVAEAWERQGEAPRALAVLRLAEAQGRAGAGAAAATVRMARSAGDLEQEIVASARAITSGEVGSSAVPHHLALLEEAAAGGPERRELLLRGIALLDGALGDAASDAARVHLAHLEVRHLGLADAARNRLRQRFAGEWCRALGCVLRARDHLETRQHARASHAAREGRALIEAAPQKGGRVGAYALAYLDLLDGVANFGAAAALADPSFLRDAFGCLTRSLDGALALDAADLVAGGTAWLAHLRGEAQRPGASTALGILGLGIDAYLTARALSPRGSERPAVPWYDAEILFPAQVSTS